jgi:fructose-1,6-bisphosphatase I
VSNEILLEANEWGGNLAALASEEMEVPAQIPRLSARRVPAAVRSARRLVEHRRQHSGGHDLFVLRCPERAEQPDEGCFLQTGRAQVAAGFATYGRARSWC